MRASIGLLVLSVLALLVAGGWTSKQEQGTKYRCVYHDIADGDTLYFPSSSYGVNGLGRGGGSDIADSSRTVNWIHWAGLTAAAGTLQIFSPNIPAGVETLITSTSGATIDGTFGGMNGGITKVYFAGGDTTLQLIATD